MRNEQAPEVLAFNPSARWEQDCHCVAIPARWSEDQIEQRNHSAPIRDVMRFHLVYSGPLSASGNKPKPNEIAQIRAQLQSQLGNLWHTHSALIALKEEGAHDTTGMGQKVVTDGGAMSPRQVALSFPGNRYVDMIPEIEVSGTKFMPLVRSSLHLNCELDILFLRQQDPGQLVSQGGDLDNRIKTLLDSLRMPSVDEQNRSPSVGSPVFCLMESDTLISRLNVDADRLLFPQTEKPHEVHLVIEVSISVLRVAPYNVCLL